MAEPEHLPRSASDTAQVNFFLRLTSYQQRIAALEPMTGRGMTGPAAEHLSPPGSDGRIGRLLLHVLG